VFKQQTSVSEAQIVQDRPNRIRVFVVPSADWRSASEALLVQEIRKRLGDEIAISVELTEAIAREPNGKFRAVKSYLGNFATVRAQ
jgi:hypothetical protein